VEECASCMPPMRADGALPLDRTKRRNGAANARRAQRVRLTAPTLQADVDGVVYPVEGSDIPPSMPVTAPRIRKRRSRAGPSHEPGATRSRRNSIARG